jgi:Malectin domain
MVHVCCIESNLYLGVECRHSHSYYWNRDHPGIGMTGMTNFSKVFNDLPSLGDEWSQFLTVKRVRSTCFTFHMFDHPVNWRIAHGETLALTGTQYVARRILQRRLMVGGKIQIPANCGMSGAKTSRVLVAILSLVWAATIPPAAASRDPFSVIVERIEKALDSVKSAIRRNDASLTRGQAAALPAPLPRQAPQQVMGSPKEGLVSLPSSGQVPAFQPIYIDCGASGEYADSQGRVWKADAHFSQSGQAYATCPMAIESDAADETLYCSERWFDTDKAGPHGYEIPVPLGKYKVTLYFSENFYFESGLRVFDMIVEGGERQTIDIYKEVGSKREFVVTKMVTVADSNLSIEFFNYLEFPKISAIAVYPADEVSASRSESFLSMYIDCGSSEDYNDSAGNMWMADAYFGNASQAYKECPMTIHNVSIDNEIYCSERWFDVAQNGPYGYEIPVPEGEYDVTLHFTENFYTQEGERVFDLVVEASSRVSIDILRDAGGPKQAFTLSTRAKISDGHISIEFMPLVEYPKVTAIEVHAADTSEMSPLASSPGVRKYTYIRGLPNLR